MSQVDDWSDIYTSDYLRDLNTYGPASANVPRPSSVVSHQVRYRAPDTSDIPLAPGQNPEGSVYSNASGARMGQLKPASGYRAPAGGGWDVNSSDTNLRFSNESGGRRYARPKRTQSRSRGSAPANGVKTRSAPLSGADVTADVLRSVKAAGNTSFANWRQSLVNQGWSQAEADAVRYDPTTGKFMSNASGQAATDHYMREQADKDAGIMADNPGVEGKVSGQTSAKTEGGAQPAPAKTEGGAQPAPAKNATGQSAGRSDIDLSGLPRERSDMTPLPGDDWSPVDKAGAGINPFESAESLAAWKQAKLRAFPILPSEMAGGVPDDAVTRFRQIAADPNSTVADVLTAENEAVKAAIDEGMTMDNIAAFEKEVALNLLFAGAGSAVNALRGAGGAARAASSTGNAWAAGSRAAAGDATAGTKAFEESLSRMNGGAVRGAPTESFAQPAASASAGWRTGRTAEYPAGTGKFDQFGGWGESGRSAVGTGSAPASDGVARFADTGYGSVGQGAAKTTSTEVAGAGADTGAASAREIMFGADAGAASRTAAGTADGGVSELANAGNVGRETAAGGAAARQGAGEAAGALAPQLQRDLSAVRQKVLSEGDSFERIRDVLRTSGGRQELLPANIREACEPLRRIVEQGGGAALTPAEREAVQLYISKSVAPGAAGAAGRGAAAAGGQAAGTAGREAAAAGGQAALNKIPEELRAEISAQRKALTAANIKPSDMLNEISEAMDTGYLSGTTYEVGRKLLQAVQAGGGEVLSAGERSIAEAYSKFLQTPKGRIYREDLNW